MSCVLTSSNFLFLVFIVEKNHIIFVYSVMVKTIKTPSKLLVALT